MKFRNEENSWLISDNKRHIYIQSRTFFGSVKDYIFARIILARHKRKKKNECNCNIC